jgi:hypothetical protein
MIAMVVVAVWCCRGRGGEALAAANMSMSWWGTTIFFTKSGQVLCVACTGHVDIFSGGTIIGRHHRRMQQTRHSDSENLIAARH